MTLFQNKKFGKVVSYKYTITLLFLPETPMICRADSYFICIHPWSRHVSFFKSAPQTM